MTGVRIRPARRRDADGLRALYWAFHEHYARQLPDRLTPFDDQEIHWAELSATLARLFADPDSTILVAEDGQKIIGLVEVSLREDVPAPGRMARLLGSIDGLIVHEAARRRGIGRQLVAAAEAWGQARGAAEIRLEVWEVTDGPLSFYARLGYRTLSRTLVKPLPPAGWELMAPEQPVAAHGQSAPRPSDAPPETLGARETGEP